MVVKPRLIGLLAFFSLVFLIHELHDWAHTMMAGGLCHCWAPRVFDIWGLCRSCSLNGRQIMLVLMAGPLITYVAIWIGWSFMNPDNPLEKRSTGLCLVFAALPFLRILAALSGGGDETVALHQLFQASDVRHHRVIAVVGLLLVVGLSLPALIRAFLLLPGWWGKLLAFPALLVLPGYIDRWVVHDGLNKLTESGVLNYPVITGLPVAVLVWLLTILGVFLLTYRGLSTFLQYDEQKML